MSPKLVVLHLKSSKTGQFRKGFEVQLAALGKSMCPYRALLKHLQHCHNPNDPLFLFSYGPYLTRQTLSDILKSSLPPPYDKRAYSSHSFRIGAIHNNRCNSAITSTTIVRTSHSSPSKKISSHHFTGFHCLCQSWFYSHNVKKIYIFICCVKLRYYKGRVLYVIMTIMK